MLLGLGAGLNHEPRRGLNASLPPHAGHPAAYVANCGDLWSVCTRPHGFSISFCCMLQTSNLSQFKSDSAYDRFFVLE